MAYGVDEFHDLQVRRTNEVTGWEGIVESDYMQPVVEDSSKRALYFGLGALAGVAVGLIAWAIGDNRLDACAAANCLADSVRFSGIELPFSGNELPVIIRSLGIGN